MHTDTQWVDAVWAKLKKKMPHAVAMAKDKPFIPYTVKDGQWAPHTGEGIAWWTNGFWPASMWQMYLQTGDAQYEQEALRGIELLDEALADDERLHHDVGFMWLLSAGVHYRLSGDLKSRARVVRAANFLAGRFNPNGFLRAWNGERAGWAIIDCMMNIPLLYYASELLGDPRYRKIAILHADTTLTHFIRPDGSVHHIVVFDPENGEVLDTPYGQGIAPGSSWSRGQAWAMYGFLLSYQHTGDKRYLDAAKRVSHYFIANVLGDWIPDCDFRAPKEPQVKDNCAGNIAACALLEIARAVPEAEAALYHQAALRLLHAADEKCADWSCDTPAIMQMCTGSYHADDHHIAMVYGDYFFIEALRKLSDPQALHFWG